VISLLRFCTLYSINPACRQEVFDVLPQKWDLEPRFAQSFAVDEAFQAQNVKKSLRILGALRRIAVS